MGQVHTQVSMTLEGKGPPDSLEEALVTHGKGSPVTSLGYGDGASVYSNLLSIPLANGTRQALCRQPFRQNTFYTYGAECSAL